MQRDSSSQAADTTGTGTLIDNLTYVYMPTMPDQLDSVKDASSSVQGFPYKATGHYSYDANGNLTADPYQGITHISYDVLNKTDTTVITSGSTYITYSYDAGGNLLRKKAYNSGVLTQTDYIDGFVYTGTGTETLSYAPMPEGRLLTTSLTQEYVITDPQGNARVSFQNNSGVAKVTQENSYYGYGLQMPGSLVGFSSPPNKHMYNGGSEWQNDTKSVNAGVPNYYQTFYRSYDPTLGRFIGVDPMAEGSASMGVYHYAGDNPIMGNDPMGDMLANPNAEQYADLDKEEQGAFMGSDLGGGGGGSIYTNPADAIGRNSDPNWMNDGSFDDPGPFSSDGGRAGNLYYDPDYYNDHPAYAGFWQQFWASGSSDFYTARDNYDRQRLLGPYFGNYLAFDESGHMIMNYASEEVGPKGIIAQQLGTEEDRNGYLTEGELMSLIQSMLDSQAQDQTSWLANVWSWTKDHFYANAEINLTEGSIGGEMSGFEGYQFYAGKSNIVSINAKISKSDTHGTRVDHGDAKSLYGGEGVIPIGDVPVGFNVARDVNSGDYQGKVGVGYFGYEYFDNQNFIGIDGSKSISLILGIEVNLKVGIAW